MDDTIISSSFYVPNILSPKVLVTVKIVAISVGGIILLIGDFLLLFSHSLNSKFLGNDLDYDAISYYVNFGGRQIFYCINFIIIIIFVLAICFNNVNLSIIYNSLSVIQIVGRIAWYVALILSIVARSLLDVKEETKKENKGLILITIVFSYEIIYYVVSFIFVKKFIKYLRRHDIKIGHDLNDSDEGENLSNDYSYWETLFPSTNDTLNIKDISWLRSDDYALRNYSIKNDYYGKDNSLLINNSFGDTRKVSNFFNEDEGSLSENTIINHSTNPPKYYHKNAENFKQSDC